ncbi:hypothetical protein SAMN05216215_10455 [Saccharopolyspora shandongensis]|uniref:Peptidase inhibitor family I36 n=1 Tax=Saccharopolyspora shandongensis TaxID=418495 RepID=A0A1H3Q2E9_9PSEU|nr:hypothetical protein [Saccharopolyspora shandongensis]SDZ06929.1 hypothetical protein SAMN05216215_10455 [Saccharopolyspora shandongensis]
MRLFQRLGIAVAATAAALATLLSASATAQPDTVSAPQAPAGVDCTWTPGGDPTSVTMTTTKSIRLRFGPAAGCNFIGWNDMPVPTTLKAICKYRNPDSGNTWYYVKAVGEESWDPGWIYSGNVKDVSGTIRNC